MPLSERQGHGAPERMSHHEGPPELEDVDQRGQRVGLGIEGSRGARRSHRVAGTGPVNRRYAILRGQQVDYAIGEITHLASQPVHQKNGGSLAALHHVQARAGDFDKAPGRRQRRLHPSRGSQSEERQARAGGGQDEQYGQQNDHIETTRGGKTPIAA